MGAWDAISRSGGSGGAEQVGWGSRESIQLATDNHHKARYWIRTGLAYLAAGVVITIVYSGVGLNTPWRRALVALGVSLTFSCSIGIPSSFIMPRLASRIYDRVSRRVYWGIMIAALLCTAVAGSIVAIGLLIAIGYVPRHSFGDWFAGSLKISIVATLTFGVFATAYETLRARLDAATVALRTKERDEADARRVAAEAELAALESRVNPHFFFNTLNSIAALVHDDPSAAEKMTTELAALLRSSLDRDSPLVSLDEELRVVKSYLEIERVRFGDRLRYEVRADDHAGDVRVPRLAVQTLVENSVKYAVTPRREGAAIAVRTLRQGGHIRVLVEDDGPGFDPETVTAGHGIALVRARLAANHGALRIESRPGRTAVTIEVLA